MTTIVPVSVGKKYKEIFDELIVCSAGKSLSENVCKAVKFYMENFGDSPMLANSDKWDKFIEESSKEEILEMNTIICEISQKLVTKWKSLK